MKALLDFEELSFLVTTVIRYDNSKTTVKTDKITKKYLWLMCENDIHLTLDLYVDYIGYDKKDYKVFWRHSQIYSSENICHIFVLILSYVFISSYVLISSHYVLLLYLQGEPETNNVRRIHETRTAASNQQWQHSSRSQQVSEHVTHSPGICLALCAQASATLCQWSATLTQPSSSLST